MPNIYLEGPAIKDLDKKRALVKDITAAASKAYGLPEHAMIVIIKENAPDNVGIGGQLLVDRRAAGE